MHQSCKFGEGMKSNNLDTGPALKTFTRSGHDADINTDGIA